MTCCNAKISNHISVSQYNEEVAIVSTDDTMKTVRPSSVKRHGKLAPRPSKQEIFVSSRNIQRQRRLKAERNLIGMLLKVSLTYFILTLPANVVYFYWEAKSGSGAEPTVLDQILIDVTNLLETCNYGVNFYLYCATNGELRKEALQLVEGTLKIFRS